MIRRERQLTALLLVQKPTELVVVAHVRVSGVPPVSKAPREGAQTVLPE
jgi:hypothetical protein